MARLSKALSFTIHEDAGIPTPESLHHSDFDDVFDVETNKSEQISSGQGHSRKAMKVIERTPSRVNDDDPRRESTQTRTSISTFPQSGESDYEPLYVPPIIRPAFMRPESVRRMQMSSPPPYRTSPRHSQSRSGTPRSVRSARARASPRPAHSLAREVEPEPEELVYPLVLLHITLLPIALPWHPDAIQALLPAETLESLRVLKAKLTPTIFQRGLLIPHPREEYDLLEERLLEALELKQGRVTKCGHFQAHASDLVTSSAFESGADEGSDSALGSSVEDEASDLEDQVCETCCRPVKPAGTPVRHAGRKWNVKVYAANGLMCAPAWAAAWNEMERVDVELMPWIPDEVRQRLDEQSPDFEDDAMTRLLTPTPPTIERETLHTNPAHEHSLAAAETIEAEASMPAKHEVVPKVQSELPRVYKPNQVPISVLLKNYILLLAQDRRNVMTFFFALLALGLTMQFFAPSTGSTSVGMAYVQPNSTQLGCGCEAGMAEDAAGLFKIEGGLNMEPQVMHAMLVQGEDDALVTEGVKGFVPAEGENDAVEHDGHEEKPDSAVPRADNNAPIAESVESASEGTLAKGVEDAVVIDVVGDAVEDERRETNLDFITARVEDDAPQVEGVEAESGWVSAHGAQDGPVVQAVEEAVGGEGREQEPDSNLELDGEEDVLKTEGAEQESELTPT